MGDFELLKEKTRYRVILFASILLISFGVFNMSTTIYAQTIETSETEPKDWNRFFQDTVEQILTTVAPVVGGAFALGMNYLRSKGLQISKEAEEYVIVAAQSVVKTQGRLLFDKVYENKELLTAWGTGNLTSDGKTSLKEALEKYKKEARDKAISDLTAEIKSSKFQKTAKSIVGDNVDSLIDRALTENEIDKAVRAKKILVELSDLAIDASFLYYDKKNLSIDDRNKIINDGIKIIAKNFDFESIVMVPDNAKLYLKSALSKKIH